MCVVQSGKSLPHNQALRWNAVTLQCLFNKAQGGMKCVRVYVAGHLRDVMVKEVARKLHVPHLHRPSYANSKQHPLVRAIQQQSKCDIG